MPQRIRDQQQIDQAMLDRYAGERLFVAARRITIIGDVTSQATELVVVADENQDFKPASKVLQWQTGGSHGQ